MRSHVSGEDLIAEHGETLFECQLEPIPAMQETPRFETRAGDESLNSTGTRGKASTGGLVIFYTGGAIKRADLVPMSHTPSIVPEQAEKLVLGGCFHHPQRGWY